MMMASPIYPSEWDVLHVRQEPPETMKVGHLLVFWMTSTNDVLESLPSVVHHDL